MNTVKETHTRTLAKTIAYRICVILVMFFLTLAFGGTIGQALSFGVVALVIGSAVYYLYERIWLITGWKRNEGYDSKWRSLVKAVLYRLVIIVVVMIAARFILTDSNTVAAGLAIAQSVTNIILYYLIERIFNSLEWGKLKKRD